MSRKQVCQVEEDTDEDEQVLLEEVEGTVLLEEVVGKVPSEEQGH